MSNHTEGRRVHQQQRHVTTPSSSASVRSTRTGTYAYEHTYLSTPANSTGNHQRQRIRPQSEPITNRQRYHQSSVHRTSVTPGRQQDQHQQQRPLILDASYSYSPRNTPSRHVSLLNDEDDEEEQFLDREETAQTFAESSPCAGYLLFRQEPCYLVLKPSTHLYGFISHEALEPSWCMDLEKFQITKTTTTTNDLQVILTPSPKNNNNNQQPILLSAKSESEQSKWFQALQEERLLFSQSMVQKSKQNIVGYKQRIQDLESALKKYQTMEEECQQAVKDAGKSKRRYESLQEGLSSMTNQWIQYQRRRQEKQQQETTIEECNGEGNSNNDDDDVEPPSMEEFITKSNNNSSLVALHNVLEQLHSQLNLSSQEATTAVQDVLASNQREEALEERLDRAEKKATDLWQDNTSIRNELNSLKKERKLLIKEVKILRKQQLSATPTMNSSHKEFETPNNGGIGLLVNDDKGAALLQDLEQHVDSCLTLQKQMMDTSQLTGSAPELDAPSTIDVVQTSPFGPTVPSLMDDDDPDDDDDSRASAVLGSIESDEELTTSTIADNQAMMPLEDEPIDATEENENQLQTMLVTDQQATSQLKSPLEDVSKKKRLPTCSSEDADDDDVNVSKDGQVYHITFYSRKIGLQFQKVPPATSANGLLTDAMTSDWGSPSAADNKTARELRRIADMTRRAKGDEEENEYECPVATPVDAVLVCGFLGFEDSVSQRPQLGARLVAFDGLSVEFGRWTFDTIRKAIQARGRPLTLSFRNDFLTTQQRSILTRAVQQVQPAPPRAILQYRQKTAPFVSPLGNGSSSRPKEESSETFNTLTSPALQTLQPAQLKFATPDHDELNSVGGSVRSIDPRSFSEVGSSLSQNVAPLVSNLLNGIQERQREAARQMTDASLVTKPDHYEFTSSLL